MAPSIPAARPDQRLGDIIMVNEVQPLVRGPVARPQQRLAEVRIALPIDEREAHDPQAEPVLAVELL